MQKLGSTSACCAFIFCISLVYFQSCVFHPSNIVYADESDILSMHYPWRQYAVNQFADTGSLPLWCSSCFSGQPFHADFQTTLFYPPHFFFLICSPDWISGLLSVSIWLHVLIAGLAMFAYARRHDLSNSSSLIAAIGFMFAGKWLLHLVRAGHYVFAPICWFPLLMLFLECAVVQKKPRYVLLAGVVAALILLGSQPQITLLTAIMGLATLAPTIVKTCMGISHGQIQRATIPGALWRLGQTGIVLAAVLAVTFMLCAVQLMPALEMASFSSRVHQTMAHDFGQHYELKCASFREALQTLLAIIGMQHYSGNPWEGVGVFGASWMAVAILALVVSSNRMVWYYWVVLIGMILFALGSATPFYPLLQHLIPGLSLFRIPSRILLFAGFPLGMLAAHCTEALFGELADAKRRSYLAYGALLLVIEGFLFGSYLFWRDEQPYWYWSSLLGPGLMVVLMALDLYPDRRKYLFGAWALLLLADLWAMHWRFLETRPVEDLYPRTEAINYLIENKGARVLDSSWLVSGDNRHSPFYLHNLESVRGYNTTDLVAYKQYLNYVADVSAPPTMSEFAKIDLIKNQSLLDLLCVGHITCETGLQPSSPDFEKNWRLVNHFDERKTAIYERTRPLPRAYVVSEARALPSPDRVLDDLKQADLYHLVFLDAPKTWLENDTAAQIESFGGPAFQEAKIVDRESNRRVVEVTRDQPGYLVLSEVWYPGWRCRTANGNELPIWRANTLFQAVLIPPGDQRLEFVFEPRTYFYGKWISITAVILVFGYFAVFAGTTWGPRLSAFQCGSFASRR